MSNNKWEQYCESIDCLQREASISEKKLHDVLVRVKDCEARASQLRVQCQGINIEIENLDWDIKRAEFIQVCDKQKFEQYNVALSDMESKFSIISSDHSRNAQIMELEDKKESLAALKDNETKLLQEVKNIQLERIEMKEKLEQETTVYKKRNVAILRRLLKLRQEIGQLNEELEGKLLALKLAYNCQ